MEMLAGCFKKETHVSLNGRYEIELEECLVKCIWESWKKYNEHQNMNKPVTQKVSLLLVEPDKGLGQTW